MTKDLKVAGEKTVTDTFNKYCSRKTYTEEINQSILKFAKINTKYDTKLSAVEYQELVAKLSNRLHDKIEYTLKGETKTGTYGNYLKEYKEALKDMVIDYAAELTMPLSKAEMGLIALGYAPKTKEKLIKELKKQGYNSMTDVASVGGKKNLQIEGYDPLIVFDKDAYQFNKNKTVSAQEENRSGYRYTKWRGDVQRLKNREKDKFEWR